MIQPDFPANEAERLHALRALQILDTSHEERFDRVTRIAKRMFGVEISLVSLVDEDRQWFKSKQGLDAAETSREISFCGHAINQDALFVVPNTLEDKRFFDNPLVTGPPNIRFYAGYPLKLREGIRLGTLCLIDSEPRYLNDADKQLLNDLGAMVEQEIRSIQLAALDELTLISNRRGFLTLAEHSQKVCRRKKTPMSVVIFDLDKFKLINDNFGHQEGDFALKQFAGVMRSVFRESDMIGRLGGDEFVAMLTDASNEEIAIILDRFKTEMDALNKLINKAYLIEYSAGVASFSYDTECSLEEMLAKADKAMYQEKKAMAR
jgi:diguanylate cyclase (GGDEF)-like protein